MKAKDLTDAALDWAVAECQNMITHLYIIAPGRRCAPYVRKPVDGGLIDERFTPSTDWAQAGPIIEREMSNFQRREGYFYCNKFVNGRAVWAYGSTLLEAAMRCYVAAKLGDEVEIPEELK